MIKDKPFRISYQSSGRGKQGVFLTGGPDADRTQDGSVRVNHSLWIPFAIGTACTMIFGVGLSLVLAMDKMALGIVIGIAGLSGMVALPSIWLHMLRKEAGEIK